MLELLRRTAAIAVLIVLPYWANAADRVALVIGNAAYTSLSELTNPVNDARSIAGLLRSNGFDVLEHHDLDIGGFHDAIGAFEDAAASAKLAVVFYAGHGMEVGGRNILAPVDASISCEHNSVRRAIVVDRLFEAIENVERKVVILDACRNDPFPQCSRAAGSGTGFRGLSRVRSSRLLLANSTGAGDLAADGPPGLHSPFSNALIEQFSTRPNARFRDVLDEVSAAVAEATDYRQVPDVTVRGGAPQTCLAGGSCSDAPEIIQADEDTGNECDRLAASPEDADARAPGVATNQIISAARDACERAVAGDPGQGRFVYQLGRTYHRSDPARAIRYYEQAGDLGHAHGYHALAIAYALGDGVPKDDARTARYYLRGAELGNPASMHNLAVRYALGKGVAKSQREAVRWYMEAAQRGYPDSMFVLAARYAKGIEGTPQNQDEAASWMLESIKHGSQAAYEEMTGKWDLWRPEFKVRFQQLLRDEASYFGPADGRYRPELEAAFKLLFERAAT